VIELIPADLLAPVVRPTLQLLAYHVAVLRTDATSRNSPSR
jgi:hypothetical protein